MNDLYIMHVGVGHDHNPPGRGSGLYPWGSGERPYQHIGNVVINPNDNISSLNGGSISYGRSHINDKLVANVYEQNTLKRNMMNDANTSNQAVPIMGYLPSNTSATTQAVPIAGYLPSSTHQMITMDTPIDDTAFQGYAEVGEQKIRIDNPYGNGTVSLNSKYDNTSDKLNKIKDTLNDMNNSSYKTAEKPHKRSVFDSTGKIGKNVGTTYKGIESIVDDLMKYKNGKLSDKARRRLDKKIKKMSDQELEAVAKRFTAEYNTIEAIRKRNDVTTKQGMTSTQLLTRLIGDQINTAMGVVGIISAIRGKR